MKREKRRKIRKIRKEWAAGALLFLLGAALSLAILPNLPGGRTLSARDRSPESGAEGTAGENDGSGNEKTADGISGGEDGGESEEGDAWGSGGSVDPGDYTDVLTGRVIVVDPGHGGIDPGKIGVHDELEKDINLAISGMLAALLEEAGATVVCTRTEDAGLYEEGDSNKKMADLKARCALIAQADPDIAVSIHQNSYTDASISGAQVFYYEGSEAGQKLALTLQNALVTYLDPDNRRQAKSDNSYYILLHSICPTVIVECGFLSNDAEAAKLAAEEYQYRIAGAILRGIAAYFS